MDAAACQLVLATCHSSAFRFQDVKVDLPTSDLEAENDLLPQTLALKCGPLKKMAVSENSAEVTRAVVECFAAAMTDHLHYCVAF